MIVSQHEDLDALVARLLGLLEEEALFLHQRRARLAEMSQALADNDGARLERLLEEMDREVAAQAQHEKRPADVMRLLAEALGCPQGPAKLSALMSLLPSRHRPAVARAQLRLLQQAQALRRQYRQTAMLLSECSRINQALLESLLQGGQSVATYDAQGPRQWWTGGRMVDAER